MIACSDHPNIVKFYDFFHDKSQRNKLCIVMEYCDDGDLDKKLGRLEPNQYLH